MSILQDIKSNKKYQKSDFTVDMIKEVFGDLFYNRIEHDNKPVMFMLIGTEKQNKKTLKEYKKAAKEQGKRVKKIGKSIYKIKKK